MLILTSGGEVFCSGRRKCVADASNRIIAILLGKKRVLHIYFIWSWNETLQYIGLLSPGVGRHSRQVGEKALAIGK